MRRSTIFHLDLVKYTTYIPEFHGEFVADVMRLTLITTDYFAWGEIK